MLNNKRPYVIHICLFHVATIILPGCQCTLSDPHPVSHLIQIHQFGVHSLVSRLISDWQTHNYILHSIQVTLTGLILYCNFGLGAACGRSGPGFSSSVPDESVPSGTPLVSHPHRYNRTCPHVTVQNCSTTSKHPDLKKGRNDRVRQWETTKAREIGKQHLTNNH